MVHTLKQELEERTTGNQLIRLTARRKLSDNSIIDVAQV